MKLTQLRQIIKEEISKALKENQDSNVKNLLQKTKYQLYNILPEDVQESLEENLDEDQLSEFKEGNFTIDKDSFGFDSIAWDDMGIAMSFSKKFDKETKSELEDEATFFKLKIDGQNIEGMLFSF
jgi:hypothetical protein